MDTERENYLSLTATGRKILSQIDGQEDATVIQKRLEEMNQRWNFLKAKSIAIRYFFLLKNWITLIVESSNCTGRKYGWDQYQGHVGNIIMIVVRTGLLHCSGSDSLSHLSSLSIPFAYRSTLFVEQTQYSAWIRFAQIESINNGLQFSFCSPTHNGWSKAQPLINFEHPTVSYLIMLSPEKCIFHP